MSVQTTGVQGTPAPPWYADPTNVSQAAQDLIDKSGGQLSQADLTSLAAWAQAEGGNFANPDKFNYWDTSLPEPGSVGTNSANIQSYGSLDQGLQAMMSMLDQSNMSPILKALQSATPDQDLPVALNADQSWGTSGTSVAGLEGLAPGASTNQSIMSYLYGAAAPGIAQGELSTATAEQQAQLAAQQGQLAAGNLQSTYGFEAAGAALQNQGLAAQQALIGQQQGTAAAQQALESGQYGLQAGEYPEQFQEAQNQYQVNQQNLVNQQAAQGALNTSGSTQQQQTLAQNYGFQNADIYRAQQIAALGQTSEQVGYGAQQNQYAEQLAQLNLAAQQEGLDVGQYQQQLQYGLSQAATGSQQNILSALQQASSAESGVSSQYAALLSQAGLLGGAPTSSLLNTLGY